MHLQNFNPLLNPSTSDITEAPVVVNPDIASNMASVTLMFSSTMYGIMPIMENNTQVSVTTKKLSALEKYLPWSSLLCLAFHFPMLMVMAPITKLSVAHSMNTHQSFSLYRKLTEAVRIRKTDSSCSSVPKILFFIYRMRASDSLLYSAVLCFLFFPGRDV